MCGLVFSHDLDGKAVNELVIQRFNDQRTRGVQGFGLFDGQEKHLVKESKEENIMSWLKKYDSNLLLFHHRWPTSTINVRRASHPFSTKDYFGKTCYILAHNGHISNSRELKLEHEKLGITYNSVLEDKTFNDSEALAWDFALVMEGKKKKLEAKGNIAFIALKLVDGEITNLYFGRNTNPLQLAQEGKRLTIASEGDGELVDSGKLFNYSYKTHRITSKEFEIPSNYTYNYSSYANHYKSYGNYRRQFWFTETLRLEVETGLLHMGLRTDTYIFCHTNRHHLPVKLSEVKGMNYSELLSYMAEMDEEYEAKRQQTLPLVGDVVGKTPDMEDVLELVDDYMRRAVDDPRTALLLAEGDYADIEEDLEAAVLPLSKQLLANEMRTLEATMCFLESLEEDMEYATK